MKKAFVAPKLTEEQSLAALTLGVQPVVSGRV
jgi:hypothetical protein